MTGSAAVALHMRAPARVCVIAQDQFLPELRRVPARLQCHKEQPTPRSSRYPGTALQIPVVEKSLRVGQVFQFVTSPQHTSHIAATFDC